MIIIKCIKCGNRISESDLFITDDGRVTKVCVGCAEAIINDRLRIKRMKEPKLIICERCGGRKLWPTEFAIGSDLCVRCSTYGTKSKKNSEAHRQAIMKWRRKNPEKYAEQKRRNRERKAEIRAEYSEKLIEKSRQSQRRAREKQKYLKVMAKIRKERMNKLLEMEEGNEEGSYNMESEG